jgi:aspartyl-tRNA(Asn)/glutamyl-tRNA(Gln) amidotransferase subunit B
MAGTTKQDFGGAVFVEYETIIGLEVHAQLLTKSKMYCCCSANYADTSPNSHVCPVCLGMPGTLPVINEQAIRFTVMTGLALHSEIPASSKFDRKNYPYPDLMKGYQISQYDMPLCVGGHLDVEADGQQRRIGITRVHLEEDVAKMIHRTNELGESYSLIDVNRSGVPLMEIVSEPDIRSAEEARQYLMKLRQILQFLGISSGNMEEGAFRCDANVSLRPKGSSEFGAKVEVKNMNSFRAVYRALEYEVLRQTEVLDCGGKINQETRGWVEEEGITFLQRSKEFAHDYRYFPEPDLPPLALTPAWVDDIRRELPELPDERRLRFIEEYGLSAYDSELLTGYKATADFYEAVLDGRKDKERAKEAANWMLGELFRSVNNAGITIEESKVTPHALRELLDLLDNKVISSRIAKEVFEVLFATGASPSSIVQEKGLVQISDVDELEAAVDKVLADNPQAVEDLRSGKEAAVGFLVGQVMKATRGKANPGVVNKLLRDKLL